MSGPLLLNRRMALETVNAFDDGAGGFTETAEILGYLWVNVDAKSGRLSAEDGASLSAVPLKITVRSAPVSSLRRPRPGQVLIEGQRRFRLLSVTEEGDDGKYLTCIAREEEIPV